MALLHDLRFALRLLLKSPLFAVVTVLTLSLGIGANAVVFSVLHAVVLKPLPYREPARLVQFHTAFPRMGLEEFWLSPPEYVDVKRDGVPVTTLRPQRRVYDASGSTMSEVAIHRRPSGDLYVALGEPLGDGSWGLRVHHKPLVNAIWFGCLLMAAGGLLSGMMLAHALHRATRLPLWACYGLVGGGLGAAGVKLMQHGRDQIASVQLLPPPETAAALQENAAWVKEQVTQ